MLNPRQLGGARSCGRRLMTLLSLRALHSWLSTSAPYSVASASSASRSGGRWLRWSRNRRRFALYGPRSTTRRRSSIAFAACSASLVVAANAGAALNTKVELKTQGGASCPIAVAPGAAAAQFFDLNTASADEVTTITTLASGTVADLTTQMLTPDFQSGTNALPAIRSVGPNGYLGGGIAKVETFDVAGLPTLRIKVQNNNATTTYNACVTAYFKPLPPDGPTTVKLDTTGNTVKLDSTVPGPSSTVSLTGDSLAAVVDTRQGVFYLVGILAGLIFTYTFWRTFGRRS